MHRFTELIQQDRRYKVEAYIFVFDALSYAHNILEMGKESTSELFPEEEEKKEKVSDELVGKHLTGQELCEAIRRLALDQFGYMSKCVLNSWGVHTTGDFGEIVFNLIRIGQMRKTPTDRREDFDDVYDFETAFRENYKIPPIPPKDSA